MRIYPKVKTEVVLQEIRLWLEPREAQAFVTDIALHQENDSAGPLGPGTMVHKMYTEIKSMLGGTASPDPATVDAPKYKPATERVPEIPDGFTHGMNVEMEQVRDILLEMADDTSLRRKGMRARLRNLYRKGFWAGCESRATLVHDWKERAVAAEEEVSRLRARRSFLSEKWLKRARQHRDRCRNGLDARGADFARQIEQCAYEMGEAVSPSEFDQPPVPLPAIEVFNKEAMGKLREAARMLGSSPGSPTLRDLFSYAYRKGSADQQRVRGDGVTELSLRELLGKEG